MLSLGEGAGESAGVSVGKAVSVSSVARAVWFPTKRTTKIPPAIVNPKKILLSIVPSYIRQSASIVKGYAKA